MSEESVAESSIELNGIMTKMIGKILVDKKILTQEEWENHLFEAMRTWVEGKKNDNEGTNGEDNAEGRPAQ